MKISPNTPVKLPDENNVAKQKSTKIDSQATKEIESVKSLKEVKEISRKKDALDNYDLDLSIREYEFGPNARTGTEERTSTCTCISVCSNYTCDGGRNC